MDAQPTEAEKQPIAVVKIGGSILANGSAYGRAAAFLRNRHLASPGERSVVVVSAPNGTTDSLERDARGIVAEPHQGMLDLLWATGELRSVALLTMHLHSLAVSAIGLNVHETGLKYSGGIATGVTGVVTGGIILTANGLQSALTKHAVVVVPGFLATTSAGSVVSLGRGGSDLTAVLLAIGLNAQRCELVKDVPGYFTADPHVYRSARHIPVLTFATALELADAGCDLVQRRALEVARDANLPLLIRSLEPVTRDQWTVNSETGPPQTPLQTIVSGESSHL